MPLHPDIQAFLDQLSATVGVAATDDPIRDARATHRQQVDIGNPEPTRVKVHQTEDTTIDTVPVRLYRPDDQPGHPVVVLLHGGGWMTGDLETVDPLARFIAARLPAIVVAVDYRRAPEHPWPAPLDDARTVTGWVLDHAEELGGDPTRVVIAGDSAGGHLSALTAHLLAADGDHRLALQILLYPATSLTVDLQAFPSQAAYENEPMLGTDAVRGILPVVFPDERTRKTAVLLGRNHSSRLAPAVIATAERDPLSDEGTQFARELAAAGVTVSHHTGQELCHRYADVLGVSPRVQQELGDVIASAQSILTSSTTTVS